MANHAEAELSLNNLFRPDVLADPYSFYHKLRACDPVHWDPHQYTWVLTRYADVAAALTDPCFSSERWAREPLWLPGPERTRLGSAFSAFQKELLFSDPPGHTQRRARIGRALAGFSGQGMRPTVVRLVQGLLDAVPPRGEMDLMREFAYPLPFLVMAEILGIPPEHRSQVKQWSEAHGKLASVRCDWLLEGLRGFHDLLEYLRALAGERRDRPEKDLMSAIAASDYLGDGPDGDNMLANCALLLTAAHETTTNLIGTAVLNLLRHPDQLERLRHEPELMPSAVEELMRFDGPVQGTSRIACEDVEVRGKRIAKGQMVLLMLAAANRDPEQFPEPDRLDLARRDNRHLAFSRGIHYCLGAELARLETQVALGAIFEQFPGIRLAETALDWNRNHTIRGLKSLRVGLCDLGQALEA